MLKVTGNKLTQNGREVILRGVNCAGLEWDSSPEQAAQVIKSAEAAIVQWKANCLRIPVSQDRWFGFAPEQHRDGRNTFISYREAVDRIIETAGAHNACVEISWN